jgi:integrase
VRQPQPYWKASHKCWYVKINGRHHRLDPDKKKAWVKYHKLMAGSEPISDDSKVAELVNQYLDWSELHHTPGTYRWYQTYLISFGNSIPNGLRLSALAPFHITRWVDRICPPATTSPSTRHGAIRAVQRAFNWAEEQGLIDRNPVRRMPKPRPRRRESYLWPQQYEALLGAIRDAAFRDLVEVMRHTGCRREEARKVTAAEFNKQDRCWDLPAGFTAKAIRSRSVPLDARAFEICERRAVQYPDGPLFRNTRGKPWRKNALVNRRRRLRRNLGFYVCPYSIRHTFATDAIVRNVDLVTIAEIMGHTDLTMLQKVYQHVSQRLDHLRKGMTQATGHLTPRGDDPSAEASDAA